MSNPYIEKLARTARDHEWAGNDRKPERDAGDKAYWIASVREILTAMREPTDDVAEVMSAHAANSMVDWRDLHNAFLDAALAEDPATEPVR